MGSSGTTSSVAYGYDAIGRLIGLTHPLAGTPYDEALTFGYNPAGQIATRTSSNDAYAWSGHYNVNRAYTSNGLNQYIASGSATLSYDANGNLSSDGSTSYVYDDENRLVSASGGHAASLAYDPLGRLWQVSSTATGTTRFLYDGNRLLTEYDGSGSPLRSYVYGPGEDEPLLWYEGSAGWARRYYHSDHEGSVIALADDGGNPVVGNAYDEYGIPNAANQGRFGYTGQAWVPELGLWYYKARMYSPTLGRFMQTDPIGYASDMNPYAYAGSDPVNARDPSGTFIVWGPLVMSRLDFAPPSTGDAQERDVNMKAADDHQRENRKRPKSRSHWCLGFATFSAIGPLPQAPGDSAFRPGYKPQRGEVAIAGARIFGLGRQALREGAAGAIKIIPFGLSDLLRDTRGPLPLFTVGDYGDQNIRDSEETRYDIYRWLTDEEARTFGIQRHVLTLTIVPAEGHCPPGSDPI
jgi:RHS repeat-associated protein